MKRLIKKRSENSPIVDNQKYNQKIIIKNDDELSTTNQNVYSFVIEKYSSEILSMDKNDAVDFCLKKIQEINKKTKKGMYDPNQDEELMDLKNKMAEVEDSLDIIYAIKEFVNENKKIRHISREEKKPI